ncbi:glycosyltransferase family 4 protein [Micromonospora lupini]|uniref:GDP-mannose-dependent alpha-(1-6)-phosphatidylinositol monomannoside mannosyltransferase n=1 Tax=Micromonospora lupini str. Lupac 08 TaxID=1150864 RepID=I0KXQ4_9ACTN|nr:glycosyltransferase family 4 protein [Micromonospora lupini]CCH16351.1 GDP-mannose-dependent alpha-(1-6)-phosphatidylinositol monomannoside mannosyltransferase [Micromonospora lupini str. Lupac 08]
MIITMVSVSDTAGGAEAHTVALGRGLRDRGHDVTLYGRCPGWEERGLDRADIRLGPKWSRRTMAVGLLRVPVERHRTNAIADSSVYYLQFKREQIALTAPLARRAPVVWTEHGRWMGGPVGRLLLAGYARAAEHVSRVVCVSEAVAADLEPVVGRDKLVVVPNAIDTRRYAAPPPAMRAVLRQRLLPSRFHDRPVAVLAARLHGAKRHDRAVAAALASESALVVVGDGPDRERLERLAAGNVYVHFTGHRDDVPDLLAASDFYVYCGAETDGTPTCVLEAAAGGLPIVAFRGDPGTELIPYCGGLVLGEPTELTADAVSAMLERRGTGVAYVEQRHGRDRWLDAYERTFGECLR